MPKTKMIELPHSVVMAWVKERESAEGDYSSKYVEYKAVTLEEAAREALGLDPIFF